MFFIIEIPETTVLNKQKIEKGIYVTSDIAFVQEHQTLFKVLETRENKPNDIQELVFNVAKIKQKQQKVITEAKENAKEEIIEALIDALDEK